MHVLKRTTCFIKMNLFFGFHSLFIWNANQRVFMVFQTAGDSRNFLVRQTDSKLIPRRHRVEAYASTSWRLLKQTGNFPVERVKILSKLWIMQLWPVIPLSNVKLSSFREKWILPNEFSEFSEFLLPQHTSRLDKRSVINLSAGCLQLVSVANSKLQAFMKAILSQLEGLTLLTCTGCRTPCNVRVPYCEFHNVSSTANSTPQVPNCEVIADNELIAGNFWHLDRQGNS